MRIKLSFFILLIAVLLSNCTTDGNYEKEKSENKLNEDYQSEKYLISKLKSSSYLNVELLILCHDFKNSITDTLWIDEPPGQLAGVILNLGAEKYFDVELYEIQDSFRFNIDRNWKMENVGDSKIYKLKLMATNKLLLELK